MFSAGQLVYHKNRKLNGKVLECAGGIAYLVQANGVEVEFPYADLTIEPPTEKSHLAPPSDPLSRTLTANDITPAHAKVLSVIPQRTMQSIATLFERQRGAGRFSALDVAEKLNFIAAVTEVPYRTMKQYSDSPGELSMMMGRGLAARLSAKR